jgi:hypothetical protein
MQTTFCLYLLVLFSVSVGVCHGLDGLDIACSPENAETLVHNNNSQSPIAKRFIEPVQQFRHVSNSRGSHQNSPRPTSQSDLRTNHQNSTRPTSQSDPRANDKNSTHQIRWWMDPKLEQIGQVTQHTSGQLAALVQTVREGFANQTNMTQNTSGQLSALLETVREGFANQTNDTQHTSDHLAKTHALLDSGLHNLTSILKNMSVEFAAGLQTHIQSVCQHHCLKPRTPATRARVRTTTIIPMRRTRPTTPCPSLQCTFLPVVTFLPVNDSGVAAC